MSAENGQVKMTRSERQELGQIVRKRERVLKSMADEHAAKMMADFDRQLAEIYSYDQDEVWKTATQEAQAVVEEANKKIAERCRSLGIPPEFAPSLSFGWIGRGQNGWRFPGSRQFRLRPSEKIERMSLTAQSEIIANGLESIAAKQFLAELPPLEELMPAINAQEIKQLSDEQHERRRRGDWES